ncbi:MAG: right-handed parallel beta-helix repeat-containing protein [Planctomycetota bacterium]
MEIKGDRKLQVTCYGIYSRKLAETAGESASRSDVHLEVAQSGGDSVYGSGDIVVVSEGKSKVYGSIQEAIDAAPAGSIVRIGPGVYKERLGIDKPLTLEGAGWDKTTIITENKSADTFEEAMDNIRRRLLEAKTEEEAKKLSAEIQAQFKAEMEEKMAAQTHLVSDTGNVVIRNLKLTSPGRSIEGRSLSVPVIKFSNAGALVTDCAIVGTPGNGINIEEGSDVEIRDSLVAGVWSTGIAVASGRGDIAKASIINCDVRNCYHRGITIGPGCDSTVVRGCRISGSSWHGIRYDNASPTIIGNLIFANVRCGIYASGRTAADVRRNLFYGNEMSGISCWFKNQDKIEENTFVANMRSGLEVLGASRPIVRQNIFYANPTAVFCGDIGDDSPSATSDGTVNLEDNLFWGFEHKVAWRHPGEAKDEVVTEEVKLDEKTRNVVFDPEFENITAEDFSLKLDSPARRSGIGAAVLIDYKSPWPLQDEEIPIIPEEKTEDTSWMGQISSTGKITRHVVVPVANRGGKKPQESIKAKPRKQEGSEHPGRISGVVVNSDTGDPIVGAYVGVGDFGDSGGSNYSRHRSQGFHDKTKTDAEGRFELGGLVFTDKHRYLKSHPLVVTHPDFVRHDRNIELPSDGPAPDVKVNLMPAAKIEVTIVDADGNPLPGQWLIRLEALDGRRFIPPGSDPHLSSFASSIWAQMPDLRARMGISNGFTFTELDAGEYSIEALKFQLVDKPSPQNIWKPTITYHGSIPKIRVQTGQAKQVRLTPQDHQTRLIITPPEYPDKLMDKLERSSQMPLMCLISRSPGALLWDDGKIRHLEDQRLGRIDKERFFRGFFLQDKPLVINNLPPDSYSLFAMAVYGHVAGCLIGARADLAKGDKITVDIPWRQPTGPSMFGPNRSFDYPVDLEAKDYSVSQICEILTEITQSNPRIIADPSIENEKLIFDRSGMSIWDLLEKLYLDRGWRLEEGQEKTLIIKPAEQTHIPVEVKEREVGSVSVIRAVDNKATLASGMTIELLGLTEIPIKDNPWWKPDSSLLEQQPFDNVSFDPSRDPNNDQFAYYAVAMRLNGKAPAEIGLIKWDLLDALHAGTTSAYLEDKRVYSQGIVGGASKFPKDVVTTTLRLGLAAGDWQTLVKGSHYGVYREGEDSIIVRTPERAGGPLGVRPGEKGLNIGVTYNVTDRDFRVVAVDKDGKVHVSARSGSSGTENLRRTTASFPDLTRDKLREFRFQTRPYEWIEFRDISLRPGKEVVALAEKHREDTKEELEKWLGQGQTRQIREQILILRNCHIFKEMETWASAVRELVRIGKPAVPELLAEMRRSQRWPTQSTAAFTLRAIGDPDSVQPLIEILGQVKYRGEYGIHLKDPQLSVFMLENQHRPVRDPDRKRKDPQITIGCPVIEITAALEKITSHTEGHEHYGHKAVAELGANAPREEVKRRIQEIVLEVAGRWQKWWDRNKDTVVSG